ncbi:hypothetical protein H2248_006935 [Termitomyces sp. 'cryptogamus']|nr:hypothetical protein H2248_006935 [Termitomyces sp. 'cryptogamus']
MDAILDDFPPLHDYDTAARLLSQLCPDSVKDSVENDLGSPESFACLLYRNPSLFRRVEDARASRNLEDFENIWNTCTNSFTRAKYQTERLARRENIPLILGKISANLNDLINGKMKRRPWTLDGSNIDGTSDVEKVNLSSFPEMYGPPSMLFHELGSFQDDSVLRERVQRLFRKGHDTFLVNASATGKTRLLYEGLCQHWGLYITSHADEGEARALQTTLDGRIYDEEDLVRNLPHKSALGFDSILARNREIANRHFSAVLLAHLLILKDFLKACNVDKRIEEIHKRRWLLAQLAYRNLDSSDPFREILVAVESEPLEFISEQLSKVIKDIRILLPESVRTDGLFIVIDEANVAVQEIWFSDSRDSGRYPALKEIIRSWRDHLALFEDVPINFVVAGTEIPQSDFPPFSQEWSSWRWTSDTGAFDGPETQKRYVLSFLPASLAQTPRAEALFKRIWDWCRPRYRLTASLVAMLLMDGMVHPHGVLNEYVQTLTGFATFDAETVKHISEEGPCIIKKFFSNIGSIVRGRPPVKSTTHEVIMHYIIIGHHPSFFGIDRVDLVSSGVGQFKDKEMRQISLDQPGPLIAAAIWLSGRVTLDERPRSLTSFNDFCFYTRGHWANGETYASASYIALYFAHVFKTADDRVFSDIFTIPTSPAWLAANRKFPTQLVKLQKNDDGVIEEMIVTPSALLPDSPPLGYSAPSAADVLAWLRHERPGVFCVCPPDCEADLIFVLKRCEGYVWIVLRTAGRGSTVSLDPEYVYPEFDFSEDGLPPWCANMKTLSPDELWPEYEHLTVENLFSRSEMDSERVTPLSDDLLDAFQALPNGLAPAGQLSMLRVIATFPLEPTLHRKRMKVSPVAVLNTATFKTVTEGISPGDLIQTLVFSMQNKRSSEYPDDTFSVVKPLSSKKRNTKRKALQTSTEASPQKNVLERRDSSDGSDTDMTPDMDLPSEPAEEKVVTRAKKAKRTRKRKGVQSRVAKS